MNRSLSDKDITDYVLNELGPRERLFVESMMLGCDQSRQEAVELMEISRLLEDGMMSELSHAELSLDAGRRENIATYSPSHAWQSVWRFAAASVALAACVAFSIAAPVISRAAFRSEASKLQLVRQSFLDDISDIADPAAFPIAMVESEDSLQGSGSDELPSRVLLPTGAMNFGEMPMPYLGGDLN
jgi:anti-sigma factor RsiW